MYEPEMILGCQHLGPNNRKDTKSESEQKSPDRYHLQPSSELASLPQSSVYYSPSSQHSLSPPADAPVWIREFTPGLFSWNFSNIIVWGQ